MPKGGSRKGKKETGDEKLDALVAAIEGAPRVNAKKQGMTKKQALALEEKKVNDAIMSVQGNKNVPYTEEQLQRAIMAQRAMHERAVRDAQYVNVPVPLSKELTSWHEASPKKFIRYEQFDGSDDAMEFIVSLFTKELTEPYSSFTYEYFVFGWPDLTIIAYGLESESCPDSSVKGERVGAVVSRVTRKGPNRPLRGYVAMFAVVPQFRGFKLGSRLVGVTIELMKEKGCEEVYLETPVTNERALTLYMRLGFVKTKFLPRYYLDHSDAVRLKLWLTDTAIASNKEELAVGSSTETA